MVKMHRAGQDNYFSDEYIDSKIKEAKQYENFIVPENKYSKYNIRKITPLEGLLLQGFNKLFYKSAVESEVSDTQLYKQIGNAVSVNVVYAIFNYLYSQKII
jgi:DNA (cytosine-5)-methyltransferase 1